MHCCFIPASEQKVDRPTGCEEEATYEIIDLEDSNPYTNVTHACTTHVGELLGHDERVPDGVDQHWEVRELAGA